MVHQQDLIKVHKTVNHICMLYFDAHGCCVILAFFKGISLDEKSSNLGLKPMMHESGVCQIQCISNTTIRLF